MCIQSKKKYSEKKNQETANQNKVAWQWLHKIYSCYLGILCVLQYLKLVSETTTAAGWIHCRCDTFHSSKEIAYLEQLGILLSIFIPQQVWPLNSNDTQVHILHVLEALQTHAVSSWQAVGLKHWCPRTRAAQSAELHRMLGAEGGCLLLFNPVKALENAFKEGSGCRISVGMVSWFTSDRSHLILSQWNTKQTVVHGLTFCQVLQCLQCATAKLDQSFLGILLRRA